jgi:outer membrane lipoprotein SlyB
MKRENHSRALTWTAALLACTFAASGSWSQRAGQTVSVQYGTVKQGREVDLQSSAVPGGAVVGGTLGLASAKGKSSSKKARNAIIGGIAGGAIGGAARGSTMGMIYDIDLGTMGSMQVVTDQREIRSGDCVAVEKAGETANVRRVSSAYCDQTNKAAVAAVASESREEAEECLAAKQQLVDAATADEFDLAQRKVGLLCDD